MPEQGAIDKYAVPAATALVSGVAAYEIAEERPEIIGIITAMGITWFVTRFLRCQYMTTKR